MACCLRESSCFVHHILPLSTSLTEKRKREADGSPKEWREICVRVASSLLRPSLLLAVPDEPNLFTLERCYNSEFSALSLPFKSASSAHTTSPLIHPYMDTWTPQNGTKPLDNPHLLALYIRSVFVHWCRSLESSSKSINLQSLETPSCQQVHQTTCSLWYVLFAHHERRCICYGARKTAVRAFSMTRVTAQPFVFVHYPRVRPPVVGIQEQKTVFQPVPVAVVPHTRVLSRREGARAAGSERASCCFRADGGSGGTCCRPCCCHLCYRG